MKKKKNGLNEIDKFVKKARELDMTYGDLQQKETYEMIRKRDKAYREQLKRDIPKKKTVEPLF